MSAKETKTVVIVKQRLRSLDFFRGITVAAMILVNNPGDWDHIYPPLEHSVWNGCTPTDLVFPFFLYIVGVSIVYAIGTKKEDPLQRLPLLKKAAKRSLIIYLLAMVLSLARSFDVSHLRLVGVLPRIAAIYFISVLVFIKTTPKMQFWIASSILVAYYYMMNFIPVPGIGAPNLEPSTNLGAWLDRTILTPNHMWSVSKTYDPEGILSTFPAISTCLLGIISGSYLIRKDRSEDNKTAWLFSTAVALIVTGLFWNGFFPINKTLWSSSFVLLTAGIATAVLALAYWLIDVHQRHRFIEPFLAFGANAITAFVVSGIIPELIALITVHYRGRSANLWQFIYLRCFASWLSPINASVTSAICYVIILSIPLSLMYRKKIFIKI